MKKLYSFFILVLLVFGSSFKTKTKPFEGTIKYAIDYHAEYGVIKYPQDLSVSIKGDIVRVDMSLPFAEMSHIIDCKKKTSIQLCTIDGSKYCVKSAFKKPGSVEKASLAKDSTKIIKDLVCYFGRITTKESQYIIYATQKYALSKNITSSASEIPYHLFFPQKEFEGKLIVQHDLFDSDGQTTYQIESITESLLKESDISPSISEYSEVTEVALGKIISDYFKSSH